MKQAQYFITVPFVAFEGRRIYLEAHSAMDLQGMKLADALGKILKDKIFSKTAAEQPLIQEVHFEGNLG